MRKTAILTLLAITVLSCKDSTSPTNPFVGTWQLISINDTILPYYGSTSSVPPYPVEWVSRALTVRSDSSATVADSVFSGLSCNPAADSLCNASHTYQFAWSISSSGQSQQLNLRDASTGVPWASFFFLDDSTLGYNGPGGAGWRFRHR